MIDTYGIYGTNYPKIVTTGGTTINLVNAVIEKDEPEWEYKVFTSVLTGYRTLKRKGAHHVIELNYFLYKAGCLDDQHYLADQLQDLLWNDTSFYYYRHADGAAYKDSSGSSVVFKLVEFKPYHLTTIDYKDAVYLKIISTKYVKMAPTQNL